MGLAPLVACINQREEGLGFPLFCSSGLVFFFKLNNKLKSNHVQQKWKMVNCKVQIQLDQVLEQGGEEPPA